MPGVAAMVGSVEIERSVGAGGVNRSADVKTIQDALNGIPLTEGAPVPPLAVDGISGPLTTAAITEFQRKQFPEWKPDSRIDPGGKTLRRINELRFGFMPPEVAKAYATIPEALTRVRAARARVAAVQLRLGLPSGLLSESELKLERWNWKLDRAENASAHLARIAAVYGRMDETLTMAAHLVKPGPFGASFHLFLPSGGNPLNRTASAFTTLGGYFHGPTDRDHTGAYLKAIYITPSYFEKVFATSILIHELAHYCGGKEHGAETIGHQASPRPPPRGRKLEDGRHDYADMTADEAFRNAQSYQVYCFPETDGRPPDSF
jgi:hypothetical protein